MSDIATALTGSIAANGETPITANIPMNNYKFTGLAAGTAATDSATLGQAYGWCGTAGGTANALTLTPSPAIAAYSAGQIFQFKSGASPNSAATTVAISGLGTIAVQVNGSACVGAEIAASNFYQITVDASATSCQLLKIGRQTLTELGAAASNANTDITSLNAPALGAATATTQAAGDSSTKVATTAFIATAATSSTKLPTIGASQGSGAITVSASSQALDFRSTTLTSGTITTITAAPSNLVIPSGATLGVATTQSGMIVVVEMNNAGTAELAVINLAGGNDLTETGVISSTTISAGATAANVFYSTTGRSNLAYRVVGAFVAVNTAGAWSSPTLIQGAGGQALTAMSSLGYGQIPGTVTRTSGTTYYNPGRPRFVNISITSNNTTMGTTLAINGGTAFDLAKVGTVSATSYGNGAGIIPAGCSYVFTDTNVTTRTTTETA